MIVKVSFRDARVVYANASHIEVLGQDIVVVMDRLGTSVDLMRIPKGLLQAVHATRHTGLDGETYALAKTDFEEVLFVEWANRSANSKDVAGLRRGSCEALAEVLWPTASE